mgnify:CR=1 FL=1
MWNRVKENDIHTLRSQGIKVREGIPCPWCDELIENVWTEHAFVGQGSKAFKGGKEITLDPPLTGLFCNCPHCHENFAMSPR